MIPLHNKELLIENLRKGYSIIEACEASQVSKASLYRLFKTHPGFKEDVERAIFEANEKKDTRVKEIEKQGLEDIKKIVLRKR